MKTSLAIILSVASISLVACTTTDSDPYPNISIVESSAVAGCKLAGHVSSHSETPYGFFEGTARESIYRLAKKEASRLGANRLVVTPPVDTKDDVSIDGQAYICP